MKPITIGKWQIVPRAHAWAFITRHPAFSAWLAIASVIAMALLIRMLLRAEYKATHRHTNKTQTYNALKKMQENLKNSELDNR